MVFFQLDVGEAIRGGFSFYSSCLVSSKDKL
jgi:hypothetical protein